MTAAPKILLPVRQDAPRRTCLACGGALPPRHRRYCANECRMQLLATLNRRTGLLKALNIRYATFHFTEFVIVMDMLPYDREQIFSYMLPRSFGKKPVADFCDLSNMLGSQWWDIRDRTKKRYVASERLLQQARKPPLPKEAVIPSALIVPSVRASSLIALELRAGDLSPANMQGRIKQAYRRQVKRHHPDIGGNARMFRTIQEAYEKLIEWSKNPTYVRRSGFPDKWLYEGLNNRWRQPIVQRKPAAPPSE
jgi:predicted nucleic acid-binding Zn ribbon protein